MTANDIRNIALLGHGGSGKTSLAEQMLFMTKGTDRLGRTADGNTTCDYDAEEIKRQISISLAFAPVNYKGVKINVMDAPGNFDFSGEALSAIRAAECAVLVGAAKDGLSVGMERSWKMLGKKPRMIFINRTDEDNSDYASCLDALKGKFGQAIAPIVAPVIDGNKKVTAIVDLLHNTAYEVKGGKAAACAIPADMADEVEALRAELMEAAAGADEELMEKFFDTMELSAEDMAKGLKIGVRDGSVCPVLCGSANTGLGVEMLLQTILDLAPVATDMPAEAAQDDDGNDIEVAFDPNGPTAAIVFKTISDQYGKYSMIKVIRGKVTSDMSLYNREAGPPVCHEGQEGRGDQGDLLRRHRRHRQDGQGQDRRHPVRRQEHRPPPRHGLCPALLQPRHLPQDQAGDREAGHRPEQAQRGGSYLPRGQQRRDSPDRHLRCRRYPDRRAVRQAEEPLRRGR